MWTRRRARSGPAENGHAEHAPPISPVVRRIADEHKVDLGQVKGSGRRGRVTKKDVLAFIEQRPKAEPVLHMESPYVEEPSPEPTRQPANSPTATGEPLCIMRKRIGEHMRASLDTAAHCTTIVEADMSAIEAARGRLSYLPFVARAAIAALREFPALNATLEGDRLTVHEEVHLGIAVSLGDDGLIVPVVRNAHELSHEGLAKRIADLAERARNRTAHAGRDPRRHVHDHEPGPLRRAARHADHQPAAGRDPRPRGGREATGGGRRG